jgi:hypothetical protein
LLARFYAPRPDLRRQPLAEREPVRRAGHDLGRVGAGGQERAPLPLRKRSASVCERADQRPGI